MSGQAYIVSSGPSAEQFDWSVVGPDDFVLAVNYSGALCKRFDAVAALDVTPACRFADVYRRDVVFYTRNKGPALCGFTNVRRIKPNNIPGALHSGAAFGLFVLHHLGHRRITAVGLDIHTTGRYSHARRLIEMGLYDEADADGAASKRSHVERTIKALKLDVHFFSPPIIERVAS